jgi:hypothetical protein
MSGKPALDKQESGTSKAPSPFLQSNDSLMELLVVQGLILRVPGNRFWVPFHSRRFDPGCLLQEPLMRGGPLHMPETGVL